MHKLKSAFPFVRAELSAYPEFYLILVPALISLACCTVDAVLMPAPPANVLQSSWNPGFILLGSLKIGLPVGFVQYMLAAAPRRQAIMAWFNLLCALLTFFYLLHLLTQGISVLEFFSQTQSSHKLYVKWHAARKAVAIGLPCLWATIQIVAAVRQCRGKFGSR